MNERIFGFRIKHLLNDGLAVDEQVQQRLTASRERAVSSAQTETQVAFLAWAGNIDLSLSQPRSLAFSVALSTAIFAAGLFAIHHWYESQVAEEIEEIDAKVLTGDLPLDAYLDKGFDAWLKRSSL